MNKEHAETALFFPIDIPFDIAYRNGQVEYPVGPHAHNGAEVYLTLTDLPDVLIGDQVMALPADTLLIIPPFCVHQLYHETTVVYERYVVNVQDAWLKTALYDLSRISPCFLPTGSPFILPLQATQKKELLELLQKSLPYYRAFDPSSLAHFFMLLAHLTELASSDPASASTPIVSASQQKVNEVISYVQEHVRENLGVKDIADQFFLNPDYLSRLFKQHAHVSLGRYLTLQKITTAQDLLRKGYSVTETSEELGFSSYAYFFKTFQKIAGISPSKYRAIFASTAK